MYKMLKNKVLLQKIETENKTKTGILLTQPEQKRTVECKVINCGPDVKSVKENDTVIADTYKLTKLDDYVFCDEDDIMAIVED